MDHKRFDSLVRALVEPAPRRGVIAAMLATVGLWPRDEAAAGPGCANVGKKCDKDKDCCSGVCKGKKDKKKCKAHDRAGCGKNNGGCEGPPCTSSAGDAGTCFTTTGKAGYCGADGTCFNCKEDKDCRGVCGPKAACVLCNECPATGGRACVGASDSACGGMS